MVLALLIGLICGYLNGFFITHFQLPPFVVTLAMLTIARGGTYLVSDGKPLNNLGDTYAQIGSSWFLGMPTPVWVSLVLIGAFYFVSKSLISDIFRWLTAVNRVDQVSNISDMRP